MSKRSVLDDPFYSRTSELDNLNHRYFESAKEYTLDGRLYKKELVDEQRLLSGMIVPSCRTLKTPDRRALLVERIYRSVCRKYGRTPTP
jgi:hypothetical protein